MRVLVCGGRSYNDLGNVWSQLDAHHALSGGISLLIHGGATGADTLARRWATRNKVDMLAFPANWEGEGRAAGPIRNQRMLDKGVPDLVIAFPGGRGTADMVARAKRANVEVIEIVG